MCSAAVLNVGKLSSEVRRKACVNVVVRLLLLLLLSLILILILQIITDKCSFLYLRNCSLTAKSSNRYSVKVFSLWCHEFSNYTGTTKRRYKHLTRTVFASKNVITVN